MDSAPFSEPKRRRGLKGQGLAYQRALAKALPSAQAGKWFAFEDLNGRGCCQPDFLLQVEGRWFILESKLTFWPEALEQVDLLYRPVLQKVFGVAIPGIVVAKSLSHKTPIGRVVSSLAAALAVSPNFTPILHLPQPARGHPQLEFKRCPQSPQVNAA